MSRVSNDIERDIAAYMRGCIDENEDVLRKRSADAGKRAVAALKQESSKRSGDYAKGWTYKVETSEIGTECIVHNRVYQLTHLLENDHKITNQTRRNYGMALGDKAIANVAERVAREFSAGGDAT